MTIVLLTSYTLTVDVTTPLPLLAYAPEATVSLRHEKFFEETSVSSGSHGLFIKAIILLGRVVNYLQRQYRVSNFRLDVRVVAISTH